MILTLILSVVLVNSFSDRNLRGLQEKTSVDIQQKDISNNLQEVEQETPSKPQITPYKMSIIEMYTMDVTKLPQFQNISTQQNFQDEDEFLVRQDSINHTSNQSQ